jgi:hypothetical protein
MKLGAMCVIHREKVREDGFYSAGEKRWNHNWTCGGTNTVDK